MASVFRYAPLSLVAALCALVLAGCSQSRLSVGALTLGAEAPASKPLTALQAFPFLDDAHSGPTDIESLTTSDDGSEVFVARFAIVDGQDKGNVLRSERRPAQPQGAWRIATFLASESDVTGSTLIQEQTIALNTQGAAQIMASIDNAEDVIVEFDPHMLAMPGELVQATQFSQKSKMRLPLIENPERTREKGRGTKTLELVGMQTVRSRAGAFECAHVREVFTSDLSLATAVRTTDHWYAPGVGLIARRWEEKVTALGLTVKQRAQAYVVLPP